MPAAGRCGWRRRDERGGRSPRRAAGYGAPRFPGRQRARGKLTARERVAALLDVGSFLEVGGFATAEPEGETGRRLSPADGVVTGTGRIEGRAVVVVAQDFSVSGGSIGRLGTAKTVHATETAVARGLPLVLLLDGGGHRIQDGQDARSFAHASPLIRTLARASGWVPMVALMLGPGFAGPTNFAGLSDLVVMVHGISAMGMAGPALVKAATGEAIGTGGTGRRRHPDHMRMASPIWRWNARRRRSAAARRFLGLPAGKCTRTAGGSGPATIRPIGATKRCSTSCRPIAARVSTYAWLSAASPTVAASSS